MYVKDHMTVAPATIQKDTTISKALDVMAKGNFHRLPVVNDKGVLIGLITSGLVSESSGAKNTSLSIYELNYLLSKTKVEDIMIREVRTISPDCFLEEAAEKMMQNEIGVLPVVDEDQKVIGIITDKDVFQALIELLGYKHQGTRFVIPVDDKPGVFAAIASEFAKNDANLEGIAVHHSERGTEVLVKATGEISVESMTKVLVDTGFAPTSIVQTTVDGEIVKYPVE